MVYPIIGVAPPVVATGAVLSAACGALSGGPGVAIAIGTALSPPRAVATEERRRLSIACAMILAIFAWSTCDSLDAREGAGRGELVGTVDSRSDFAMDLCSNSSIIHELPQKYLCQMYLVYEKDQQLSHKLH